MKHINQIARTIKEFYDKPALIAFSLTDTQAEKFSTKYNIFIIGKPKTNQRDLIFAYLNDEKDSYNEKQPLQIVSLFESGEYLEEKEVFIYETQEMIKEAKTRVFSEHPYISETKEQIVLELCSRSGHNTAYYGGKVTKKEVERLEESARLFNLKLIKA